MNCPLPGCEGNSHELDEEPDGTLYCSWGCGIFWRVDSCVADEGPDGQHRSSTVLLGVKVMDADGDVVAIPRPWESHKFIIAQEWRDDDEK